LQGWVATRDVGDHRGAVLGVKSAKEGIDPVHELRKGNQREKQVHGQSKPSVDTVIPSFL
jgi:hypothetical protein